MRALIVNKADDRLSSIYKAISENKKRAYIVTFIIYSLIFAAFFLLHFTDTLISNGFLLGSDGVNQYLPFLKELRSMILQIVNSFLNGDPSVPMMNFRFCFGEDNIITAVPDFMPLMPIYMFSALFPEDMMPQFITAVLIMMLYASGLTFIFMCSHFKENCILAGVVAPFWVFCDLSLNRLVYNPHFVYMLIAFPLLIVGIDRILNDKSGILFTLSVLFLGLSGISLLMYTMPFVILFAAVRLFYIRKEKYLIGFIKYFLKGFGYTLLGLTSAGVILMPYIYALLNSTRSFGSAENVAALLMPDLGMLSDYLSGQSDSTCAGLVFVPFILYVLSCPNASKELRTYQILAIVSASLPLVLYSLNGFQYALDRWSFIYSIVPCFACVRYLKHICLTDRKTCVPFVICMASLVLSYMLLPYEWAPIPPLVCALVSSERHLSGIAVSVWKHFTAFTKKTFSDKNKFASLFIASLFILIFLILAAAAVLLGMVRIVPIILIVISVFSAITILSYKSGTKMIGAVLIIAFCVGTQSVLMTSQPDKFCSLYPYIDRRNAALTASETGNNVPIRYCSTDYETASRLDIYNTDDDSDNKVADQLALLNRCDNGLNSALAEGPAFSDAFSSILNSGLISFFRRIGQDSDALPTTGQIVSFSDKEPLFSLFGIQKFVTVGKCDAISEALYSDSIPVGDGISFNVYDYKYALPLGTTYDSLISREKYNSFGPAELPFAMMNNVWLEGYKDDGIGTDADIRYGRMCGFEHTMSSRGMSPNGIECFDNTIRLTEDVKGCFLYLTFDGVETGSREDVEYEDINIKKNGVFLRQFRLFNKLYTELPWMYLMDSYTLSLGLCNEDAIELTFISSFRFSSVSVYAIPFDSFIEAYSDRCNYAMSDVKFGTNTIEGQIDVPDDRALTISMIYNKGWTAYVDGEKADIYRANGVFLGIPLTKGYHDIKLVYRTPLLYEGAALSLAGIAVIIIIAIKNRKNNKMKYNN